MVVFGHPETSTTGSLSRSREPAPTLCLKTARPERPKGGQLDERPEASIGAYRIAKPNLGAAEAGGPQTIKEAGGQADVLRRCKQTGGSLSEGYLIKMLMRLGFIPITI